MPGFFDKLARSLPWGTPTPKQKPTPKVEMVKPMSIAFPLYIYPSIGAWSPLFNAITENPSTNFNVIVNPNSGPGSAVPDSDYIKGVSQLNSYDNVNLFGYVHTTWGARNISDIEAEISLYELWANYSKADIHVDGIFLDEAPSDTKFVEYMSNITKYTKATLASTAIVWSNPGVAVDASLYEAVDIVNAYENSWDHWARHGGKKSIPAALRAKSTIMIHSYDGTSKQVQAHTDALVDAGYQSGLLTTDSSYTSFSPLLSTYVESVATADSESTDPCS